MQDNNLIIRLNWPPCGLPEWYKKYKPLDATCINPRPDGPLDFPPPDGGLLRASLSSNSAPVPCSDTR